MRRYSLPRASPKWLHDPTADGALQFLAFALKMFAVRVQAHLDRLRLGVANHIRERFLSDAKTLRLDDQIESSFERFNLKLSSQAGERCLFRTTRESSRRTDSRRTLSSQRHEL